MDIWNFLAEWNYTMLNKPLAKKIWISQAVFLCELISQRKRFKQEEFYFTQNDMVEELWISEASQLRYTKELKEKWLINVEKKGIPAKNWYKINDEKIYNIIMWETCAVNLTELEASEWRDYSNNKDNNKENNNSESNLIPKQDITDDAHHSGCDLTNYNFDTFWKEFPHARKGKKKESEQYFNKQDAELVKKQVGILNFKINAWLQDAQFIPACERRIRDFTPISDIVLKQELLKIARWHLNAWGDIKARAKQLKETFGEDAINEAVKTIQQKDSPKNLFINK